MDEYDPKEWEGLSKQQMVGFFYLARYQDAVKHYKLAAKHLPLFVQKGLAVNEEGKVTVTEKGKELYKKICTESLKDYGL
jgi:predicted methyltransferase